MKGFLLVLTVYLLLAVQTAAAQGARGVGINVPVIGRLVGAGNTLYRTSVEVVNNSPADRQIDFYFDGINTKTNIPVAFAGSIDRAGNLVETGKGTVRAQSVVHFDDFIEALGKAFFMSPESVADGYLGSILFVFNNSSRIGEGTVVARFYNDLGAGTVGVALKGREISSSEARSLSAPLRDTARGSGKVKLYSNLFVNNIGFTPSGTPTTQDVTVEILAYSNTTGQSLGVPISVTIGPGRTASIGNITAALQVPASEETVYVIARVVSGDSAIQGVVNFVDATTRDGSLFEMTPGI